MKVVAEIGTNWNGDYKVLDTMIKSLAESGVDFVKFQALDDKLIERHNELDWYESASMSIDNVEKIDKVCAKYEMNWFCTPCYPEAVTFLNDYVSMWKIRAADKNRDDIIGNCISTGKPIYISASRPDEISIEATKIKKVFCISKYPTQFGELNFDMIKKMDGYSNHCKDPLAVFTAVRMGVDYLEFHVMPSSDYFTIDSKVSFTLEQVKEMMYWINNYRTFE